MNMSNLFNNNSSSSVLVIGDVMLDKYMAGDSERISPEAPVPVVNITHEEARAGGAANVALNIASLDVPVSIISLVGRDKDATELINILESKKVKCNFAAISDHPTITKLRVLSRHQQLLRLDFEKPFSSSAGLDVVNKCADQIKESSVVVLSDYAKGSLSHIQSIIEIVNKEKKPILVDPKGTDFSKYRGASLLTPNFSEFENVVGKCKSEEDVVEKARKLMEALRLRALLITRSEKGMTLIESGKDPVNYAAKAKDVFDVTGAGDTVIAVLAAGLASGLSLARSVELSNIAAGIVVSKVGTATVNTEEIQSSIYQHQDIGASTNIELATTLQMIQREKVSGKKVVFTFGAFDILNLEHINFLKQAKSLGDLLVVGIKSDKFVKNFKGDKYPINDIKSRSIVVNELQYVDYTFPLPENGSKELLEEISPDCLVMNGGCESLNLIDSTYVEENADKVIFISSQQKRSGNGLFDTETETR